MWSVYTIATLYHKLPCEVFDPDRKLPSLVRYLGDKAVTFFGITIDNARQERIKVGNESQAKYTLYQLLDDNFRLPRPMPKPKPLASGGLAQILAMAGQPGSGVKMWKYVGPEATLPS